MPTTLQRRWGRASTINFALTRYGLTDLEPSAPVVAADVTIIKDEQTPVGASNPVVNEGQGLYSLLLDSDELEYKRLCIIVRDVTSPKVWEDEVIFVETVGGPDAQHPSSRLSFSAGEFLGGLGNPEELVVSGRRSVWALDYSNSLQPFVHMSTTKLLAGTVVQVGVWWDNRGSAASGFVEWEVTLEGLAPGANVAINQPSGSRVQMFTKAAAPSTIGIGELVRTEMTADGAGITIPDHEIVSILVRRRSQESTDTLDSKVGFYMLDFITVG
jgi:hypothetical protein